MTARLLVAALVLVAIATQPLAFDLPGLKRSLLLAISGLLLLLPSFQRALVRTLQGGALRVVAIAGGFAVAAAGAIATRGLGGAEIALVLRSLLELLLFALIVVLARDATWEHGETLLRGMVALGGLIGAVAVAQVLGFDPIYEEGTQRVPVATFGNTNAFAAFAAPCLAVAFARGARRRACASWLCLALLAAALVLARSRGAWIAASAGVIAAAFALRGRFPWRPPGYAIGAGVMLGLLLELAMAGSSELADKPLGLGLERTSNKVRLDVARSTLDLVGEQPLLGCGPGRFRDEYPLVRREEEARTKTRDGAASVVDHPHNELLRLLAEGGGLTAGLALLAALGAALALLRADRATRNDDGSTRAALAGGGAAWLCASLFWSTLFDPATALLGALLAGAALAGEVEVARSRKRERPLALLGTLALLAGALWFAVPALRAEWIEWRVALDRTFDARELDDLERAAELDAYHVERQYAIGTTFLRAAQKDPSGGELHLRRARDCFRRALAVVPNHVASLEGLAKVEARRGDDQAARTALIRLHALEPWLGPVEPVLSYFFAQNGLVLPAARARLAAEGDAAVAPLLAQAKALRASGRNRPAAQVLDLIAPLRPEDGDLWREYSLALQELDDDAGFRRAARQSQIAYAIAALADGRSEEARGNLDVARRHAAATPGSTALEDLLDACVDLQRNRLDEARARLESIDAIAGRAALDAAPPTALKLFRMLAGQAALAAQARRLGLGE